MIGALLERLIERMCGGCDVGMVFDGLDLLEGPRGGNADRHLLPGILVIALCTILCGGETCTHMALCGYSKRELLESFLSLRTGIPSYDTFSKVFRCWTRRHSRSGFWGSCASLPKAARVFRP